MDNYDNNEAREMLTSRFMALQSSYLLLIKPHEDTQHTPRGPTTFARVRKNNPDDLISDGISDQEFRRLFRLVPVKYRQLSGIILQYHPFIYLTILEKKEKGDHRWHMELELVYLFFISVIQLTMLRVATFFE